MSRYLLGIDVGSSSVKVTLMEIETGKVAGTGSSPKEEMSMISHQMGWAEQDPEEWWKHVRLAVAEVKLASGLDPSELAAIGISYQMHGLVLVDKSGKVLRPSIIWCDSRAVEIGDKAFNTIGSERCLAHMLNSPGNFTASKLKWVQENEVDLYNEIHKFMLPGDFIAMKLTGELNTTASGLSEGILWDFLENKVSDIVMEQYGFSSDMIPDIVPTFSIQGLLSIKAAEELGLRPGIPVSYRAGDQPNNAFSLNVVNGGEIAATAGTSGVIYGIADKVSYDTQSRVNTFIHVNHDPANPRYGVLLCINGTGILNSWLKHHIGNFNYDEMNKLAAKAPVGTDGLMIYPFGNGAERVLGNKDLGARILGLNFNRHTQSHLYRAAQEGIVCSMAYGLDIMKGMGLNLNTVKAGRANMFLSPVFREAFVNTTGRRLELYNTDGSQGAARAAGLGSGIYTSLAESFTGLTVELALDPDPTKSEIYQDNYGKWINGLNEQLL